MKVKVKELYEEGDSDGLSPTAPAVSIAILDDFGEYQYEFFMTKSESDAMKRREREYEEVQEQKEKDEKKEVMLVDRLAELEHQQWCTWSREIVKTEDISSARVKRWESLWIPYGMLSEEMKEYDRKWARYALGIVRETDTYFREKDMRKK